MSQILCDAALATIKIGLAAEALTRKSGVKATCYMTQTNDLIIGVTPVAFASGDVFSANVGGLLYAMSSSQNGTINVGDEVTTGAAGKLIKHANGNTKAQGICITAVDADGGIIYKPYY